MKVPAVHEPVIPEFADIVVGVTGLDCIGKKICDIAHRPEDVAEFLRKKTDEPVMWEDVVKIAVIGKDCVKMWMKKVFWYILIRQMYWNLQVWLKISLSSAVKPA